jgi:hypothetical protein
MQTDYLVNLYSDGRIGLPSTDRAEADRKAREDRFYAPRVRVALIRVRPKCPSS